jgi:hypothetical protein
MSWRRFLAQSSEMTHLSWFADPAGPGQFLVRDPNPQAPGSAAPGQRVAARPIAFWGLTDRARSERPRLVRNYALLRRLSGRS